MLVKRAFKFKLKPTKDQEQRFVRFAGARRYIYNRGLAEKKQTFETTGKSPSYFEQNKALTPLKKAEETNWLKEIHSQVLQQSLKDLNSAFDHFFRRVKQKEKPGFPKFKKKGIQESFRYPQGVKVEGNQIFLPKIGWVKYRKSREVKGTIKETTIRQDGNGWSVSFSCEWEKPDPKPAPISEDKAIGIDVGLKHFATVAAGRKNQAHQIENPRFLSKNLGKLKYLSRRVSKKALRGANRLKARARLAKFHTKIRNLRTDFVQQLSSKMIKNHDIFCIETLDIKQLLEKNPKGLSRAISDVGWRSFLRCLKYKAEETGKHVIEAGKYFASSQICASCGNEQKMPLEKREYNCDRCGVRRDRDYNSAIVLKAAGMTVLKLVELPS